MNLSTIQKGLEQETQFSENVSAKDRLMRNLHLASNIKSDYRKLIKPTPIRKNIQTRNKSDATLIHSHIEPRISEIANKKDKTRLINQPYNTLSEEISVNPFYKNNITKVMVINSKFRDKTLDTEEIKTEINSSNFYMKLNYKFKNVISMSLLDICLPNNLYNISESLGNNKIYIKPPAESDYTSHTIPSNKYTIDTLKNAINNLNLPNSMKLDYDLSSTQPTHLEFEYITHDYEIKFDECDDNYSLGYLLGFKNDYYYAETSKILAEYPPKLSNISGCKYYYLMVNDFNNNVNDYLIGNLTESFINKNILARITCNCDTDTILFENKNIMMCRRNYFGPVDIDRFHIQLLNEYGNLVDLQGYDFNMSIEFKIQY